MAEQNQQTKPEQNEAPKNAGDFMDEPFAKLFGRLSQSRFTGCVDIRDQPAEEGGKILKRVLMAEGARFAVQGGRADETLIEILLADGDITKDKYYSIKEEHAGNYGKIEKHIMTGAVVPPADLSGLVARQISLKISNMFSLIKGFYQFKELPEAKLSTMQPLMPLDPLKLTLEAAKKNYPQKRVKKEMPDFDSKNFTLDPLAKELGPRLGLDPKIQRWLRGLPAQVKPGALLKTYPDGPEAALALFLSWYFQGLMTVPEEQDDFPFGHAYDGVTRKPKAPPKPAAAEKKDAPKEAPKKVEEPKLPIEEMLDAELSDNEIVVKIDELLKVAKNKDKTYFDLLGVDEKVPAARTKKIYFKFARKFHPDARPDLFQSDIRTKVETLFSKITEAYDAIGDEESKKAYIDKLKSRVSDEEMQMAQRAIEAEMEFQKADIMIRRGQFKEAKGVIDKVIQLQPEEPEYKMYQAWVDYKIKGPSETAAAKKIIEEVLKVRPNAVDGHLFLGMIAKAENDLERAEQYLQKVAQAKPHDVDIKRELQFIRKKMMSGPSKPAKKKGGLFGKK